MKRSHYLTFILLVAAGCAARVGSGEIFLLLLDPAPAGQDEIYLTAALGGVPVVERGCVRIASPSGDRSRTVLWHRGTELGRDATGYYLRNAKTGTLYRFGQKISFGGGEMPQEWAERGYPEIAKRCGPPYASGWLPK